MDTPTAQAFVQFGVGRRGAERLPPDPAAWLLNQIAGPDLPCLDDPPTTPEGPGGEAIRPHVSGHFGNMLLAVMRHPAMLLYMDNIASFGSDNPAGGARIAA